MKAFHLVRTITPQENCPPVRAKVWFRVRIRIRVVGNFPRGGANALEPFAELFHYNEKDLFNYRKDHVVIKPYKHRI